MSASCSLSLIFCQTSIRGNDRLAPSILHLRCESHDHTSFVLRGIASANILADTIDISSTSFIRGFEPGCDPGAKCGSIGFRYGGKRLASEVGAMGVKSDADQFRTRDLKPVS